MSYVLYEDGTYVKTIIYQPSKPISVDDLNQYVNEYLTSKSLDFVRKREERIFIFYKQHSFKVGVWPKKNTNNVWNFWLKDISGEHELIFDELKQKLTEKYELTDDT
jgi:hypothetical protein